MTAPIGHKTWAVPDGMIPSWSNGPGPEMVSHESLSILNPNKQDATVEITVYFSDKAPAGPYTVEVPAERTLHQRTNALEDPEPIPPGEDYAVILRSDVPIIVQHTRLDSRQAENAISSTIAYALPD
jgi:hypothetical protein